MGVPLEVVHPIHVELALDDPGERVVARHEPADLGRIDPGLVQEAGGARGLDELADLLVGAAEPGAEERLGRVAVRPVAHVVEKCGRSHGAGRAGIEIEVAAEAAREVHGPERVLEAGVIRAGVDEVCESELPDLAEALEQGRVHEREERGLDLDVPVDRVPDRLRPPSGSA